MYILENAIESFFPRNFEKTISSNLLFLSLKTEYVTIIIYKVSNYILTIAILFFRNAPDILILYCEKYFNSIYCKLFYHHPNHFQFV